MLATKKNRNTAENQKKRLTAAEAIGKVIDPLNPFSQYSKDIQTVVRFMYETEAKKPLQIADELSNVIEFAYPKINFTIWCFKYYSKVMKSCGSKKLHTMPTSIKEALIRLRQKEVTETKIPESPEKLPDASFEVGIVCNFLDPQLFITLL